jgi:beta-lysine 5,6-aminomutase beta subunit
MSDRIRPYGDALGDGIVQTSFTLPVAGAKAEAAARELAIKMGLADPVVAHAREIADGFTFFVVYGSSVHEVDLDGIDVGVAVAESWPLDRVERTIREELGHDVVVVGAAIESDAHTVGIDSILNMKGYHGHYGLERCPAFRVVNMGAQVPCERLIRTAVAEEAHALLVSLVVTQNNAHIHALTRLVDMLEGWGKRGQFLLVAGGPRLSHELARELGYDAGFGAGTVPDQVATWIVEELVRRKKEKNDG